MQRMLAAATQCWSRTGTLSQRRSSHDQMILAAASSVVLAAAVTRGTNRRMQWAVTQAEHHDKFSALLLLHLRSNFVLVPAAVIFAVSAHCGNELGHRIGLYAPVIQTALAGTAVFSLAHLFLGPRIAAHALCSAFVLFNAVILYTATFGSVAVLHGDMEVVNQMASSIATTAACTGVLLGMARIRPPLKLLTVSIGLALGVCNAYVRLARTSNVLAVWNFARAFVPFVCASIAVTMGRLPSARSFTVCQLLLVYDVVLTDCMAWESPCSVAMMRFVYGLLFMPHVAESQRG